MGQDKARRLPRPLRVAALALVLLLGCQGPVADTNVNVNASTDTDPSTERQPGSSPGVPLTESQPIPASAPAELEASQRSNRRRELAQTLAQEGGWNLYETAHYFVATPVADPMLVEGAKRRLESLRARLDKEFPTDDNASPTNDTLLRILPSRSAFEELGGQPGTSAFWKQSERLLVCYDAGSAAERETTTWPALQHVLVHEYLGSVLGLGYVPPWMLYGIAANYEALMFEDTDAGGSWSKPAATTFDGALRRAVAGEAPMHLKRLLAFDSDEFHGINEFGSPAFRNLVLARAFVGFAAGGGSDAPLPEMFLQDYASALRAGDSPQAALTEALAGASLDELNSSWQAWVVSRTSSGPGSSP